MLTVVFAFPLGCDEARVETVALLAIESSLDRRGVVTMLIEPRPWSSPTNGGYIDSRTNLVRIKQPGMSSKQFSALWALDAKEMQGMYDGINTISAVRWKIDARVHDLAERLWNHHEGGHLATGVLSVRASSRLGQLRRRRTRAAGATACRASRGRAAA